MFESQLIVVGSAQYADSNYPTVLQHLRTQAEETVNDEGCIEFSITIDPANPGLIATFERWETEELHQKHLQTEHVKRHRERMVGISALSRSINCYIVADGRVYA